MEVDLIELWNQLKTCMEKDRSALLERWNQVRFEKLSEFRREFDSLDLAKMIEQVQWEESIQTKGYAIDRGLLPLYEDGLTAVYRARKNFDSNLMFCKVYQIQQQKQTTQADFGRFLASLSLFKNVNLVSFEKLFEVTKTKKFYLMMPYPFSGNVSDYLGKRKQPVTLDMAKSWTRCLAGALSYLHSIGIGHTNVTMSSLMLKTDEMQLQLTIPDQYVQAMGKSSAECTTGQKHKVNPYFAYEKMFANLHDVTLADVWQMGCIHYYALTLQHPFVRKKNAEFLQDIERKYWSFVGEYDTTSPRIDPSTKDFLSQIFTLEANRITSIEVLNHPYLASN